MNDYISREAALNFEAEITAAPGEIQAISQGMSLYAEHIKAIPAADVVEVVRCQNCKYCDDKTPYELWCLGRGWPYQMVPPDGFCDRGKRRPDA